jgi:hypothetical protein
MEADKYQRYLDSNTRWIHDEQDRLLKVGISIGTRLLLDKQRKAVRQTVDNWYQSNQFNDMNDEQKENFCTDIESTYQNFEQAYNEALGAWDYICGARSAHAEERTAESTKSLNRATWAVFVASAVMVITNIVLVWITIQGAR